MNDDYFKADTDDFQSQLKALQTRVEKKQEEALAKQESIDRAKESVETIMKDMAEIIHQYIHHRLYHSKTGGLDYRRLSVCQEYTSEIVKMGIEFESCYPSLFAEISKQLRFFILPPFKQISMIILVWILRITKQSHW